MWVSLQLKSDKDLRKKRRYILLSKLWVLGTYELIRFLNDLDKKRNLFDEDTKTKLKEALTIFLEVRAPLAKFQKSGKD